MGDVPVLPARTTNLMVYQSKPAATAEQSDIDDVPVLPARTTNLMVYQSKPAATAASMAGKVVGAAPVLSLIHISEPTRPY